MRGKYQPGDAIQLIGAWEKRGVVTRRSFADAINHRVLVRWDDDGAETVINTTLIEHTFMNFCP